MSATSTAADPVTDTLADAAVAAPPRFAALRRPMRVIAGIVGTGLDGFVVGFALAYLAAVALSGASSNPIPMPTMAISEIGMIGKNISA